MPVVKQNNFCNLKTKTNLNQKLIKAKKYFFIFYHFP